MRIPSLDEAAAKGSQVVDAHENRARTLRRLRTVVMLALLLPTLAYVAVAAYLYKRQYDDARLGLDRAARVAAEHALKLFDTNEMLLQRMNDLLADRGEAQILADGTALHQRLRQMASTLPQVQGLFVFGSDSRMLLTSRANPAPRDIDYRDRAWFRAHQGGAVGTFFTPQIVSRLTGEPAFDMSQRRVTPAGDFAGTLHVSLRPEYLTTFYAQLAQADPGLRMALLRQDGAFLARWPGPVAAGQLVPPSSALAQGMAGSQPSGQVDGESPFDGVRRLRSFYKLEGLPLYVVASIDQSEIVARWQRLAGLLALFVFPTTLGFAGMTWVALARTRDEFEAVGRLDEETARRQRAELGLVRAQKLEAIGRLTGGVAHDFNNLLAVVGSSLEVLRRLHPDLAKVRPVQAMDRAVTSGVKLTRQLLAFARTQAVQPERLLLQDRVPALAELLRPLLGSSIALAWHVDPETAPIKVDLVEFELALINLAVNAADAMQGVGQLRLSVRNAPATEILEGLEGHFVLIDIDDTGPGIEVATAARAFEPFFTTKAIGKGTGLGLSQVRGLCRSTGGEAAILRAPDGGARVRLLLRATDEPAAHVEAAPLPDQALKARVLLVEDNDEVALAVSDLLETLGCSAVHAAEARTAKQLLQRNAAAFDVVLSDIAMPGPTDGIALAGWVRDRVPELPVILMTGYAPRLEQAVHEGLAVLPKPFTAAVLAQAIRAALRSKQAA